MTEYLTGILLLAVVWLSLLLVRRDLKKHILWGSFGYLFVIMLGWALITITSQFTSVGELTVPGYWHPPTLFNLGFITGGLSIEDALFSFLVGGIATVIYEVVFNSSIKLKVHHRHHLGAFLFGFIFSAAFAFIYKPNPIYALIAFGLSGAIFLCVVRRDLILHSLFGGVLFMLLYFFNFLIFNSWFPYFVDSYYNLKNISGIMVLSVPFEELLYALSFGMLWAPVYEYEHGLKNKK